MASLRAAPLAAWSLLAAVTAFQFVWADDHRSDDPPAGDRPAGARPAAGPWADDVAAAIPGEVRRPAGAQQPGQAGRDPATNQDRDVPALSPVIDDPAHWPDQLVPPEAVVATVVGDGVASLADPSDGDPVYWFANPTEYGGQRTFLVVDATTSPDHVKVSLPVMPNGQEGWLPRSAVSLHTVTHRAEIDLSEATVTVWDGANRVVSTRAVTGRPTAPTPLGRFYIRDIIAQTDPGGPYGPWILALSGFSETLTTFGGGLPALALHGTDEPDRIGTAISSGCVRVPNEVISLLAETVPLGTPVTIVD